MQKLRYHQPGTAPATLVSPPEQVGHKPVIKLIDYDGHSIEERGIQKVEEVFECLENKRVSWIDVSGLGDVELLRQLGRHFRIHPLALEDVLSTGQRPKVDEYDGQTIYFVANGLRRRGDCLRASKSGCRKRICDHYPGDAGS
jgi:magnesium transporter